MISKLLWEKKFQENSQIMFQICVLNQKIWGKNHNYILKTFLKYND
jgi:hypothetical protein